MGVIRRRLERRRSSVVAATLGLVLVASACVPPIEVETGDASLELPCGPGTTVSTTWYFPVDRQPEGLVWLQHGFSRSRAVVNDLARAHTARNHVVVAPSVGSFGGCSINTPELRAAVTEVLADFSPNGALRQSADAAAVAAGRTPAPLPERVVVSGHSAGGALATVVGAGLATHPEPLVRERLAGVVLLDPVESNGAMAAALPALADTPVLTVSAPPDSCNASASGTAALVAARHGFVGVQLDNGCHCDAEGASTNFLCTLVCGSPRQPDINSLQFLATVWTADMVRGLPLEGRAAYPGSDLYGLLVDEGIVSVLEGTG
ncbi:MAG: alpha/beta hydrolase fold domain-containing protein [Acidimicrobiia bacterium]|nr:alpha/beta hydrolase fold domain-containing protein [Acidimicrobiia bacterium]